MIGMLVLVGSCGRSSVAAGICVSTRRKLPSLDGGAGRDPDGRAGGGFRRSVRYDAVVQVAKLAPAA